MRILPSHLAALIAGLVAVAFLQALPNWQLVLTLAVGAGTVAMAWPRRRALLIGAAALFIGVAWAGFRAEQRLAERLPASLEGVPVTVEGTVRGFAQPREWGSRLVLDVDESDAPLPQRLMLSDFREQDWPPGSRWRLKVRLKAAHGTLNGAGFDAEAWLWSEGLLATGSVAKGRQRLADAGDFLARVDKARDALWQRIRTTLGDTPAAALIGALTVGQQQAIAPEQWRQFSATGLTHLVSISGLHITLLAALVGAIAYRLACVRPSPRRPPRIVAAVAGLVAATIYALLAGWSVPTQRSLYMLAVFALALLTRRHVSALSAWLLALAAVLVIDPFSALAPGLWLSFGLVGVLFARGAGRRAPLPRVKGFADAQGAATLASIAPLAVFFGTLPWVSPLANAVAIPLVSALLTPLALAALALPFGWPLEIAGGLAELFLAGVAAIARLPTLSLAATPWPLWLLALAGTLWVLAPRAVPGRLFGLACLAPLLLYRPAPPAEGAFRARLIDVGQGLSLLIETHRHTLLYDTGPGDAERGLLPALSGQGVYKLDALVLSHHDADHDGAAASLLARVSADRLYAGQPETLAGLPLPARYCRDGVAWDWDGVRFAFLTQPTPDSAEDNAKSCVLRVSAGSASLLVAGDLPAAGEAALADRYGGALKSTVLIAPHHGSKTSTSAAFLDAVAPRWAWIGAGYRNRYRHPHPTVLARLAEHGIRVARSDRDGGIEWNSGQPDTLVCEANRQKHYWRLTREGSADLEAARP
ncbi:DNA internalization-related competence protein ComEC/Rec2 [Crenobacter cavernae]|uniref:DNA internalization-related competence protein ComEC/Rec2 n=1 Tax=Crenobacter cavernae TaxID=2290923 RepID=A0A345Y5I0_9NEIS|nr:DNA internalization-related competence protein ComEC/Rec2 [Crenobacter cavernae]AXK39182.1 DNA internalization-related competence protein ComEC/Rec2 [Crenobacter cavernae]